MTPKLIRKLLISGKEPILFKLLFFNQLIVHFLNFDEMIKISRSWNNSFSNLTIKQIFTKLVEAFGEPPIVPWENEG